MIAFIDGDILIHTIAHQVEEEVDWGDDMWTMHADLREAQQRLDIDILEFKHAVGARSVRVALSDTANFRKEVYPEYKANRRGQRKPLVFRPLREYVREVWRAKTKRGLEADDLLGIWATERDDGVIVSTDKDFRSVPCRVYNPRHPDLGVYEVTREAADHNHLVQTLSGDRADGYPGCPGIGEKRAEAIAEGGWQAVVEAYAKAGCDEGFALTQARLAYILRHGDYRRGKVRLWTP